MRPFNPVPRFVLMLSLSLILLREQSFAITGGEAAAVAGIAAGTAAAVPLVSTALTRSGLEVTVEVYRDTVRINRSLDEQFHSADEFRSMPFHLGTNAALQRAMPPEQWTPAIALGIAEKLAPYEAAFSDAAARFESNVRNLKALPGTPEVALIRFNQDRAQASQRASDRIRDYRSSIVFTRDPSKASAAEMAFAADRLGEVREALESIPQTISEEVLQIVAQTIQAEFLNAERNPASGNSAKARIHLNDVLTSRLVSPTPLSLPRVIFPALQLLREITRDNGVLKEGNSPVGDLNVDKVRTQLVNVILYVTGPLNWGQLLDCRTLEQLTVLLNRHALPLQMVENARRALEITYVSISVGANFGPLVNEAFQGVFSNSRVLDEISDTKNKNRWSRLNYVESDAGAGDHNAVVYFDDTLTPVLKTAKFDPSEFVAANAQVFKRVALNMANTYGVPLPAGAAGADSMNQWNLLSMEAESANIKAKTNLRRKAVLSALDQLIGLNQDLQAKMNGTNWINAESAVEFRANATNVLGTLCLKLQQAEVSQ